MTCRRKRHSDQIFSSRCQKTKRTGRGPKRNQYSADISCLQAQTPTRTWWSQTGSNRRPHACKARALPTELWPRPWVRSDMRRAGPVLDPAAARKMVGPGRLERPTSRLSGVRSNHLSYGPPIPYAGCPSGKGVTSPIAWKRPRKERETKTAASRQLARRP